MKMYVHYFSKNDAVHNNLINILNQNNIKNSDALYAHCLKMGMKKFTDFLENGNFSDEDDEIMNHL